MDPHWLTDPGFLHPLLHSPTFYRQVLAPLLLALALPVGGCWVLLRLRRGQRLRQLHGDQGGVAMAVDAVLTLPIFLSMVMLTIQLMLLGNAALVTHYAAFSAARSARVWANAADPDWRHLSPRYAERAARLALVAVSPGNPRLPNRNLQPFPESLFSAIARNHGQSHRRQVFLAKARYAFDQDNVVVTLTHGEPRQLAYAVLPRPARARVTYQVYLNVPFGWILARDRGDGVRTRPVSAEMEVL